MKGMDNVKLKPSTYSDELRLASRILWWAAVVLTSLFVGSAVGATFFVYIGIFIGSTLTQYMVTKFESVLLNGVLPVPWSERATTNTKWLWCAAVAIMAIDILILNLGGCVVVAKFIKRSMTGDALVQDFGFSENGMNGVMLIAALVFAALVAVGPELLRNLAEHLDSKQFVEVKQQQPTDEERRTFKQRQEETVPVKSPPAEVRQVTETPVTPRQTEVNRSFDMPIPKRRT